MRGWVYIIINKAMPELVKIGYSTKDPKLRAEELNHTGSPHPYEVVYDVLVINPHQIEQQVHKYLIDKREGKEWYRCTILDAVSAIRTIAKSSILLDSNPDLINIKHEINNESSDVIYDSNCVESSYKVNDILNKLQIDEWKNNRLVDSLASTKKSRQDKVGEIIKIKCRHCGTLTNAMVARVPISVACCKCGKYAGTI
jgi:hypothetical protein